MAAPSKENGYVSIPNELYEAILLTDFSKNELKVIFEVIRFTDGFNREEAQLSLRFISKGTKINHSNAARTITSLFRKKVLVDCGSNESSGGRIMKLNRDYQQWKVKPDYIGISCTNNESSQNNTRCQINNCQNDTAAGVKTTPETGVKLTPKKDINKDKLKTYPQRRQNFINEVLNHKTFYPKELLEGFLDYWLEPNQAKTKMKFEFEKTFDTGLRLKKWARNAEQWERNKSPGSGIGTGNYSNLFKPLELKLIYDRK